MYKCNKCGEYFNKPKYKTTTYGSYYGAEDPYNQTLDIAYCPYCDEENDFEECCENEQYVEDLWKDIRKLDNYNKVLDSYFSYIVDDFRDDLYDYESALVACDDVIKDYMLEEDRKYSWDSLSKQLNQIKENTK